MKKTGPLKINSITEFHRLRGLPKPQHPLISVIDYSEMNYSTAERNGLILSFYTISAKTNVQNKLKMVNRNMILMRDHVFYGPQPDYKNRGSGKNQNQRDGSC